jgi:hypothetical protein
LTIRDAAQAIDPAMHFHFSGRIDLRLPSTGVMTGL